MVRKIATRCACEEDEWHLQTCYGRANRLKAAAITKKHAAIKGMPRIPQKEAECITQAILDMKGATAKKHKDAHAKEQLRLLGKPLTYRGSTATWKRRMGKHDDWTKEPAYQLQCPGKVLLKDLACPACMKLNPINGLKMHKNSAFSNLKCKACGDTTSSKNWACPCGLLWYKCSKHVREVTKATGSSRTMKRTRIHTEWGVDKPLPKARKVVDFSAVVPITQLPRQHIELPPDSKLARKFPHLVKRTAEVKCGPLRPQQTPSV